MEGEAPPNPRMADGTGGAPVTLSRGIKDRGLTTGETHASQALSHLRGSGCSAVSSISGCRSRSRRSPWRSPRRSSQRSPWRSPWRPSRRTPWRPSRRTWSWSPSWTLARSWRTLVARPLVGLRRRLMLAMDARWLGLDLRVLSNVQKGAGITSPFSLMRRSRRMAALGR